MILGIENRTENWRTAYEFAPLFTKRQARLGLVNQLLKPYGKEEEGCVSLELYWKGLRDYLYCKQGAKNKKLTDEIIQSMAQKYVKLFPDLRNTVEEYRTQDNRDTYSTFAELDEQNYLVAERGKSKSVLANNLYNTEVDIVLESPNFLFLGEAKHESSFSSDKEHILVHQLIRQYVMASVLLDCLGCGKTVVPFVVGGDASRLKRNSQVDFMIWKCWMSKRNVLSWSDISKLTRQNS